MNSDLDWHLVLTKPNCEKKVVHLLSQRGFETYCPFRSVAQHWSGKEVSRKPLFSSWVFVRCNEQQFDTLKHCRGVVNIMYWLGKPAVVPNEQISTIKFVLNRFKDVGLVKTNLWSGLNTLPPQKTALSFPLFSLGYWLVVSEEQEMAKETLGTKDLTVSALKSRHPKVRLSNLLKQLPTMLAARKTAL